MIETETSLLDVHAAACLAGGTDRVVDAVLAALVETGRVRVQRDGQLTVVDRRTRDAVEGAVLDAIGTRGHRTAGLVRQRVRCDVRVTAVLDRLLTAGLLAPRRRGGHVRTRAGRQAVRQLRATPPVAGVAAGTSAAAVALRGPAAMPDPELRAALFESARPVRTRRWGAAAGRRRGARDVAGSAALYGSTTQQYGDGHGYGYGADYGGGYCDGGHSGSAGCGGGGCGSC
jgi:hypothetical protein